MAGKHSRSDRKEKHKGKGDEARHGSKSPASSPKSVRKEKRKHRHSSEHREASEKADHKDKDSSSAAAASDAPDGPAAKPAKNATGSQPSPEPAAAASSKKTKTATQPSVESSAAGASAASSKKAKTPSTEKASAPKKPSAAKPKKASAATKPAAAVTANGQKGKRKAPPESTNTFLPAKELTPTQIRAKMQEELAVYAQQLRQLRFADWALSARSGPRRGVIPARTSSDFKLWCTDAAAAAALAASLSAVSSAHSKRVALLGNNGDGKSTLLNLLMMMNCMSDREYESALPAGYVNEALARAHRRALAVGEDEEVSFETSFCLPNKCAKKRQLLPNHEVALCTSCLKWYHLDCVGGSTDRLSNGGEFVCPLCVPVTAQSFALESSSELDSAGVALPRVARVPKRSAREIERLRKHELETVFQPLESTCTGSDANFLADFLLPTGRSGSVTTTCNVRVVYGRTFAMCVEYWSAERLQEAAFEYQTVASGSARSSQKQKTRKRKHSSSTSGSQSSSTDGSDSSSDSDSDSESSESDAGVESRADERTYARRFHALTGGKYALAAAAASSGKYGTSDPLAITDMEALKRLASVRDVQLSDLALGFSRLGVQVFMGDGKSFASDRVFVRDELRKLMPSLLEATEDEHSRTRAYCVKDVTVFVPSHLLENGLELLDIPGVNDTDTLNKGLTHDGLAKSSHIIAVDRRNLRANESLQEALKDHVLQRLADREKGFGLTFLLVPEVQSRQGPDMFFTRDGPLHSEWAMAREESMTALSDLMVGFLSERAQNKNKGDLDTDARNAISGVRVFTLFPKLYVSMRLNNAWQMKHGPTAVDAIGKNTDMSPFLHMLTQLSAHASHDSVSDTFAILERTTQKLVDRLLNDVFKVAENSGAASQQAGEEEHLFQSSVPQETMRRLQDSSFEYFSVSRAAVRDRLQSIVDDFFGRSVGASNSGVDSWFQELSNKAPRVLRKRFKTFRKRNKHRLVKGKRPRYRVSTSVLRTALTVGGGDAKGLDLRKLFFSGLRPTTRTDLLLARLRRAVEEGCVQVCVDSLSTPILQNCVNRDLVHEVFSNSSSKSARLQQAENSVRQFLAQSARDHLVADVMKSTFEFPTKLITVRSIANLFSHAERHAIGHVVQGLTKKRDVGKLSRSQIIKAIGRAMTVPGRKDSSKKRRLEHSSSDKSKHKHKAADSTGSEAKEDSVDEHANTLPRVALHSLSKMRELVADRVVERFTVATNRNLILTEVSMVESFLERNRHGSAVSEAPWLTDLHTTCGELERTCSKVKAFFERLALEPTQLASDLAPVRHNHDDVPAPESADASKATSSAANAAVPTHNSEADTLLRSMVAHPEALPTNGTSWPTAQARTWIQDMPAAIKFQDDILNWIKPLEEQPAVSPHGLWSADALSAFQTVGFRITSKPCPLVDALSATAFRSADASIVKLTEAIKRHLHGSAVTGDLDGLIDRGDMSALFAASAALAQRIRLWVPRGVGVKDGCKLELRVFSAIDSPVKSTKAVTDFEGFDIGVAWIAGQKSRLKKDRKLYFVSIDVAAAAASSHDTQNKVSRKRGANKSDAAPAAEPDRATSTNADSPKGSSKSQRTEGSDAKSSGKQDATASSSKHKRRASDAGESAAIEGKHNREHKRHKKEHHKHKRDKR